MSIMGIPFLSMGKRVFPAYILIVDEFAVILGVNEPILK